MAKAEWVAVDWGTSNVRAWGIAADLLAFFSRKYGRVIVLAKGRAVNHPGTKPNPWLKRALHVIPR